MPEHVTSIRTYVAIYIMLMVLLALTVGLAFASLGGFEALVAYSIAVLKAVLVILFFMEVRVQGTMTKLLVTVGFIWLAVLLVLSTSDYVTRGWGVGDEQIRPDNHPVIARP